MDETSGLIREEEFVWRLPRTGKMRVPAFFYASADLVDSLDEKALDQLRNVAGLPGIVKACYAMPDAHWGYGFPIGGVAAFDPEEGGIISAGGVGFDISCGVRTLLTGLKAAEVEPIKRALADSLFENIPAGIGSTGTLTLDADEMNAMLEGGARWACERGYGEAEDLAHTEENGCMAGAEPDCVSAQAKKRQRKEMGTLGSGNHYLEVQRVAGLLDEGAATAFGLAEDDIVVSIHCGSRGLGHQIGTEFLREMAIAAPTFGIELPDRELACAPIKSDIARRYLGAMRAAMNCAMANRQIITHLTRDVFARLFPTARLRLLYDVSHNTCKVEIHDIEGVNRRLYVHRKGATRAFPPGHAELPEKLRAAGQPVIIGGSMGTESYILVGTQSGMKRSFGSACHGAGRSMSRHQALKRWRGRNVIDDLAARGILIRSPSLRGIAEEAPGAYKDVARVVETTEKAGLAKRVARLEPLVCIKG